MYEGRAPKSRKLNAAGMYRLTAINNRHPHGHMSGGCCCVWRYRTTASLFLLLALFLAWTSCENLPNFVPLLYCFCTRFLGLPKLPDTYRRQGQVLLSAGLLLLQFWLATGTARGQNRTEPPAQPLLFLAPFLLRFCYVAHLLNLPSF